MDLIDFLKKYYIFILIILGIWLVLVAGNIFFGGSDSEPFNVVEGNISLELADTYVEENIDNKFEKRYDYTAYLEFYNIPASLKGGKIITTFYSGDSVIEFENNGEIKSSVVSKISEISIPTNEYEVLDCFPGFESDDYYRISHIHVSIVKDNKTIFEDERPFNNEHHYLSHDHGSPDRAFYNFGEYRLPIPNIFENGTYRTYNHGAEYIKDLGGGNVFSIHSYDSRAQFEEVISGYSEGSYKELMNIFNREILHLVRNDSSGKCTSYWAFMHGDSYVIVKLDGEKDLMYEVYSVIRSSTAIDDGKFFSIVNSATNNSIGTYKTPDLLNGNTWSYN